MCRAIQEGLRSKHGAVIQYRTFDSVDVGAIVCLQVLTVDYSATIDAREEELAHLVSAYTLTLGSTCIFSLLLSFS